VTLLTHEIIVRLQVTLQSIPYLCNNIMVLTCVLCALRSRVPHHFHFV